jgi:hypothetical protein
VTFSMRADLRFNFAFSCLCDLQPLEMPFKVPLPIVDCVAHCFTKPSTIQQKLSAGATRRLKGRLGPLKGDWKASDILRTFRDGDLTHYAPRLVMGL